MQSKFLRFESETSVITKNLMHYDVGEIQKAQIYCQHRADMLGAILKKFMKTESQIINDLNLSNQGKQSKVAEAKNSALDQINELVDDYQVPNRIAEIESKLSMVEESEGNEIVNALKEFKIDEHLRSLKKHEIQKVFFDACRSGDSDDQLVIRTVLNAHKLFPLLDYPEIEKGKMMIAERKHPELVAELKDLRAIKYVTDRLFDMAKKCVD